MKYADVDWNRLAVISDKAIESKNEDVIYMTEVIQACREAKHYAEYSKNTIGHVMHDTVMPNVHRHYQEQLENLEKFLADEFGQDKIDKVMFDFRFRHGR